MDDLVLDFQNAGGQPTDSTLWLRNGGGKSSILNLFFAIVRPHKGEFLGGKAEARQRSLNDYVLPGDRAIAAAEWQLDPPADSLGLTVERFLTGVFYERREGGGDLRRLFFATRVSSEHAETSIAELPLFTAGAGSRSRRTLTSFRDAWRDLRTRAPHLGVVDTENQREWQEVLEGARIDPELYSYQVRMNQREGGADELFRFAEPEDFVDFLLELALDPSLADSVGRNIGSFRRELVQRKEHLLPERELVAGLAQRMEQLRDLRSRREQLRAQLGEVRAEISGLETAVAARQQELGVELQKLDEDRQEHAAAAERHRQGAKERRARAARLQVHAARLRLTRLEDEHEQVQEEWRRAQRTARIWAAAVPLRRALQFEAKAEHQRSLLQERLREHAPLRAELEYAALQLAAALAWRSQEHRRKAGEAVAAEQAARRKANDAHREASEANAVAAREETRAKELQIRLAEVDARRTRLVRNSVLESAEDADSAVVRWTGSVTKLEDGLQGTGAALVAADEQLEALDRAIGAAAGVQQQRLSGQQQLETRLVAGKRDRELLESDRVLRAALELETIDADRLGDEALATLEHAARAAQGAAIEAQKSVADDEQAVLHIEDHGLLPPSADARQVTEFLQARLGGQAWPGWSWIESNVPKADAKEAVRRAPTLAQGVVVRPDDLERAAALLREAGIEPRGPLLLASTESLNREQGTSGLVLGPAETAWFDKQAAELLAEQLRLRLEQERRRIQEHESQHSELVRAGEKLRAFRTRYPLGWFASTERDLQQAEQRAAEARTDHTRLQEDRRQRAVERRKLETKREEQQAWLLAAQASLHQLQSFVEDYFAPSRKWSKDLAIAKDAARRSAEASRQSLKQAQIAEELAAEHSKQAKQEGEEARVLERERAALQYMAGDVNPEAGALDERRDRYGLLKDQYEQRVGSEPMLAMAKQNDEYAREERTRFENLLTPEVTATDVAAYLDQLAEPDTVDRVRDEAETRSRSLFGKMGNLKGQIDAAVKHLQSAEEACSPFGSGELTQPVPATPELAEQEAVTQGTAAEAAAAAAAKAEELENLAREHAKSVSNRQTALDQHVERARELTANFTDLLQTDPSTTAEPSGAALDEGALPTRLARLGESLRKARRDWQELDKRRSMLINDLRAFATSKAFERLDANWVRRLQEHDEQGLESGSGQLLEQLELRRSVLEEQIANIDRHRSALIDELHAVAEAGLKLLRQATNQSRLPDHLPGIGGVQFLRIQTQEPDDPAERRARLADLIDELLDGQRDPEGIPLAQAAVQRVARPIKVHVLHPDPALDRRTVSIPEMARSSGGEQLTGAILLYCTLARVRARARGQSRHASSVLVLDNPIGRASRVRFLELQREVARAMGVQLIYTTGVNDHEALRALPNIIRLRNERVDRNSGRRLVEHLAPDAPVAGMIEAVRIGRREQPPAESPREAAE
ncbi:MAG TPA: hypothetical protein VFZ65_02605 [Planctomycetota bacterium]|nr:hypothetical protein [Planctomycetota bacterium]